MISKRFCKLRHLSIFTLFVYLLALSPLSFATDINSLNPVESLEVEYSGFEQPMTFNVTLPASYQSKPEKRYFVLFDLHPRSQTYLSGLHDWLSHNGEWPWLETIIVTQATYHKEFAALFESTANSPKDHQMLDILQNYVLKSVTDKYRTNGFNMYSGFMSNGAIGLYALLNKPELFNAYFLSTPTLNNDFLNINSDANGKLKALSDKQRFVYLTIGEHGYEKSHIDGVNALKLSLERHAPSDLVWEVKTQDPHYYMTRPIYTVLDGIQKLFDDYHTSLAADSPISKQGPDAIVAYYQNLSKRKYGFDVSAEGSLKNLASSLLDKDPKAAIDIYQTVVDLYPESAYAYSSLAKALEQTGQLERAISMQTVAVEKSLTMGKWHQNRLAKQLTDLKNKLEP